VAIEHLEHFLHEADKLGVVVLLAGLRPDFLKVLDNLRFRDWLPADRIFPEEQQVFSATLRAVRHAYALIEAKAEKTNAPEEKNPIYYLV
jgi:SulP family sulfate permease